ncbi:MAG: 1-acyl-sn-glycerol-3-phosphate acyltransferase [Solirubrobacteraceae bacterium]
MQIRRPPAGRPWRYLLSGAPCDADALGVRERGGVRSSTRAKRIVTSLLSRTVVTVVRTRFQICLSGELPPAGCVLVSHHDSYWDGVVAAALDPRVVPITSSRWRSIPALGSFLDAYGVLWTDAETISHAMALVGRGDACWLAPHAFDRGRGHTPAHLGAARICTGAGVPLVPLVLSGLSDLTRGRGPRSAAEVSIGLPVWPKDGEEPAEFSARAESALPGAAY